MSWPGEPSVRFEILDEDIGQQIVDGFARYGMRGTYLGSLTRVVPGGIAPCFAFEIRLPRDKPPLTATKTHFGEVMTVEQKRRLKQRLAY